MYDQEGQKQNESHPQDHYPKGHLGQKEWIHGVKRGPIVRSISDILAIHSLSQTRVIEPFCMVR